MSPRERTVSSATIARIERRRHRVHDDRHYIRLYGSHRFRRITAEQYDQLLREAGPWVHMMDAWYYRTGWWAERWFRPDEAAAHREFSRAPGPDAERRSA